ncbi:hypothetical protein ANN_09650, partial [Periplaneta americana]
LDSHFEEQRLRVFENKILRKIFGAKRDGEWRKLHNVELHTLYSSPDIIRNIKFRGLKWAEHLACMGESRTGYRVLVGWPEERTPGTGIPRSRECQSREYDSRNWCYRPASLAYENEERVRGCLPDSMVHFARNSDNEAATALSAVGARTSSRIRARAACRQTYHCLEFNRKTNGGVLHCECAAVYCQKSDSNEKTWLFLIPAPSNEAQLKKKKLFDDLCKDESDNSFVAGKQKTGYLLVDIELLSEAISGFVQCKYCSTNCISVLENSNSRRGLACRLVLVCKNCGEEHTFPSSKYTNNGYEVNLRFVYSMRCIGKGSAASKVLCSVLNLPKPPTRFQKVTEVIERSLGEVATECMVEAAKEAVQENAGSTDIAIAIDGSWQKRGHFTERWSQQLA